MPTPYVIAGPDGTPTGETCRHAAEVEDVAPSTTEGCEDCLREGTRWVHLRMCLTCGHVGCCDSSPRRHAREHWNGTAHPIIASHEPGEDWAWCFPEETLLLPRGA